MSTQKDIKKILKDLKHKGWRVVLGTKHWQCYHPGGKGIVTMAQTPSCPFAVKNIQAEIKRVDRLNTVREFA